MRAFFGTRPRPTLRVTVMSPTTSPRQTSRVSTHQPVIRAAACGGKSDEKAGGRSCAGPRAIAVAWARGGAGGWAGGSAPVWVRVWDPRTHRARARAAETPGAAAGAGVAERTGAGAGVAASPGAAQWGSAGVGAGGSERGTVPLTSQGMVMLRQVRFQNAECRMAMAIDDTTA